MQHPEVAFRDCDHCHKWLYARNGQPEKDRQGNLRPRHKLTPPACRLSWGTGCPKGTPENSKALSEKNVEALRHYLECKAVGQFPDDPIVRRNAGIIRQIEDSVREERMLLAQLKAK